MLSRGVGKGGVIAWASLFRSNEGVGNGVGEWGEKGLIAWASLFRVAMGAWDGPWTW